MKYLDFTRRAGRAEFWGVFVLASLINLIMATMIAVAPYLIVIWLAGLVICSVAIIAAMVSRIRDTGYNVLWILVCFIPYIGTLALIVFGCLETKQENS